MSDLLCSLCLTPELGVRRECLSLPGRAGQGRAGQCKDRLEAAGQNTENTDPADRLGWTGQHSRVMTEHISDTNTGLAFTIHIRHQLGIYQNKDLDFYIGGILLFR